MACLIDYLGFRLTCLSKLPIDGSKTLIYGCENASARSENRIIVNKDEKFYKLVKTITDNLLLGERTEKCGAAAIKLCTALDVEGHKFGDNYYLLDFARTFPPEQFAEQNADIRFLYCHLRPELLSLLPKENRLVSDAGSPFITDFNTAKKYCDLIKTAQGIIAKQIENFAFEMCFGKLPIDLGFDFVLITFLHEKGLNIRHLGRLFCKVDELDSVRLEQDMKSLMKQAFVPYETREGGIKFLSSITQANHPTLENEARAIVARFKLVDMWKTQIMTEMVARCIKHILQCKMKDITRRGSIGLGYRDVKDNIVLILNKLLTSDAQLWENVIWPCLQLKFFSNVDQKTSVLSLEEFLQFCKPRETSLRNFTWRVEIVEKVSQMCGLVFSDGFFTNLRNGQAEDATEPIKMFYLISLEPVIKFLNVGTIVKAYLLQTLAEHQSFQTSTVTLLKAEALLKSALKANPRNYQLWIRLGRVYKQLGDAFRAKICNDIVRPNEKAGSYYMCKDLEELDSDAC